MEYRLRPEFQKYKPPSWCRYPADDWDYCWGYAQSVDEDKEMNCDGCEYKKE